jgi:hypothetical protein
MIPPNAGSIQPAAILRSVPRPTRTLQGMYMDDTTRALDVFQHRVRIRSLAPEIESLAGEYARQCEPLRNALNVVLDAGPDGWKDALYSVGGALADIDLSDASWGVTAFPDRGCSNGVLARHTLLQLTRAAVAHDRVAFDRWLALLDAEPCVRGEVGSALPDFLCTLMAQGRTAARGQTLGAFRDLLNNAGVNYSYNALVELNDAGCRFTPATEDVVRHWLEADAGRVRYVNGRIAPLGDRTPLFGGASEAGVSPTEDAHKENAPGREQERRSNKRLTEDEHRRVEDAVREYIEENTKATTEPERRRLAKGINIQAVAEVVGRSTGYISTKCETWKAFQAEREKWERDKHRDALDRARESKQFANGRSDSRRAASPDDDSGRSVVEAIEDERALEPADLLAYEELQREYLKDEAISEKLRTAFLTLKEGGRRLVLDNYAEDREDRHRSTRARKTRS